LREIDFNQKPYFYEIRMPLTDHLNLERPLAIFDIESTGTNRKTDRIIDLAIVKIHPDGSEESFAFRVNPGRPIPKESTAIHGITDADVADAPIFKDVANEVQGVFEGCDLGGFSVVFYDIPMLQEEFIRAGMTFNVEQARVVDAQRIFHIREPRDLTAAYRYYCGESLEDAHTAMADTQATARVIAAQFAKYTDLPKNLDAIDAFCNARDPSWLDKRGRLRVKDGKIVINFGKHQDETIVDLVKKDVKFLEWFVRSNFPREAQEIVQSILNGEDPTKWVPEPLRVP
jgi:DNA polymerase III subunit epsilon